MARAAYPLRLPAEERLALEDLSRIEGRPMNQLLNEAVRIYLNRRGKKESTLAESLNRLHAYRRRDPDFQHAMQAFAEAELMGIDPAEGKVVATEPAPSATGPVQNRLRDLLRA